MHLPDDIDRRIRLEYAPGEAVQIQSAFDALMESDKLIGARVLRCILHLAAGRLQRVIDLVENARMDYRDVILWAEYDDKGKTRLRDFNKPF